MRGRGPRDRAVAALGAPTDRVICPEHGSVVGEIRHSPEGRVFCAEVPVEGSAGVKDYLKMLREEARRHAPPIAYQVRYLVGWVEEHGQEPEDQPMAWCEGGRHRIMLHVLDFGAHSAKILLEPI